MLAKLTAEGIDLIATPTQAQSPPPIGVRTIPFAGDPDDGRHLRHVRPDRIFNLLGWPAVSVPCGTRRAGLPVGIQLAALPWREDHCLAAAAVVEAAAL